MTPKNRKPAPRKPAPRKKRPVNAFRSPQEQRIQTPDGVVVTYIDQRDAFTTFHQDKSEYLTPSELCEMVGVSRRTVQHWCEKWFGKLPPERAKNPSLGYRIPLRYFKVAKFWASESHTRLRNKALDLILRDPGVRFLIVLHGEGRSDRRAYRRMDEFDPKMWGVYNWEGAKETLNYREAGSLLVQYRGVLNIYYLGDPYEHPSPAPVG